MPDQTITTQDIMDPARAEAMHITLGRSGKTPSLGDSLPPFWHYAYFWDVKSDDMLGQDGHPKTGGFIPDMGLERRMWAGGKIHFEHNIQLGKTCQKISRILEARPTTGRTGPLAVVSIEHQYHQSDQLCIRETQNLIYRAKASPDDKPASTTIARQDETLCDTRKFSTTTLFRYSALTFNGHRIHYDHPYATTQEGYNGLVVHGPLLAQYLIHMAQDKLGGLSTFEFRAIAPLIQNESADFCATDTPDGLDLWVRAGDGRLCMQAKACPP